METNKDFRRYWLAAACAEVGGQAKLAELADLNVAYISQVKNGSPDSRTKKPKQMGDDMARKIEVALSKPIGWMDRPPPSDHYALHNAFTPTSSGVLHRSIKHGAQPTALAKMIEERYNVTDAKEIAPVPVISSVMAGRMTEIGYVPDLHELDDAEMVTPTKRVGPRSWALKVDGYSMHDGTDRGIGPGWRLICDPDKGFGPGSFVISKNVNHQGATFKQLVFEDGVWMLRPLNRDPIYETVKINDPGIWVIAVVTEAIPPSVFLG